MGISLTEGDEITDMYCSCRKNNYCKHEAAVLTFIEENDFIENERDFINMVKTADNNHLREYLINLLNENPEIKKDFIRRFRKELRIDDSRYFAKLESIIDAAKGRDYASLGVHDIESLANGCLVFLNYEIDDLMRMGQYEVVIDLIVRMGRELCNELYAGNFSWYDACDRLLEVSYELEEMYGIDDEKLEDLYEVTSFIGQYM